MKIHILFGMGDCKRIKQILESKATDFKLFVFEPYEDNFKMYKDFLPKDKRILFMLHSERDMVDFFASMFQKEQPEQVYCETLDKYAEAYPIDLMLFEQAFNDAVEIYNTSKNTFAKLKDKFEENIRANMIAIRSGRKLSRIQTKGDTAYIIAAGPSLDKNISELKNAKGMIIATDTAINPLLYNGIIPDLAVTIDANKSEKHFANRLSLKIPLIAYPQANKNIIAKHKAEKYFIRNNSYGLPNDKEFRNMPKAFSCGSVTSDAMHVATLLGYEKIVFVGLDLAYTNDKAYAKGTVNQDMSVKDGFSLCKGIDGTDIPTTRVFEIYRKWIERYIKARPQIQFFDCTEGGAKIDGTEIMDLKTFNCGGFR